MVRQRLLGWITVAAVLLLCGGRSMGDEASLREYQIKAERICSFAHFIEWPIRRFTSPEAPFVIGVYGRDQISDMLLEAIQGRRIKNRPVVIKHILAKEELPSCHILFVSRSERDNLPAVLNRVRREGVLTVGETDNFLSRGGVINLFAEANGIRFHLSRDAARRERLAVSSKLLQLAIRTQAGADRPDTPTDAPSAPVTPRMPM